MFVKVFLKILKIFKEITLDYTNLESDTLII